MALSSPPLIKTPEAWSSDSGKSQPFVRPIGARDAVPGDTSSGQQAVLDPLERLALAVDRSFELSFAKLIQQGRELRARARGRGGPGRDR